MKKLYPNYTQWQTIMRFSFCQILLAALLSAIASAKVTEAQELLKNKITVQMQNENVGKILNVIESQIKVKFLYSSNLVKSDRKISVNIRQEELGDALSTILKPLDLGYEISGKQIILKRVRLETENLKANPISERSFLDRSISGTVKDNKGEVIPGASVVVKGMQRGTNTDMDGSFKLDIPDGDVTLTVSFVGYISKDISIMPTQSRVDVALISDEKILNEVVVVGYGTAKKKDLTGSVAVVKVAELTDQPNSNLTNQLQGRASGVTVLGSGQPGTAPEIRIRGINTFGNNRPLYVVDGIPTDDISTINPNDISTMQILKDAGSASIYGSRAANGVVIISTKRGAGKVKISYDAYYGTQRVQKGNVWNLLDAQGMADLKWLVRKNTNDNSVDAQYGGGASPVLPDYIVPTGKKAGEVDESTYYVNPNFTDAKDFDSFTRIVKANKSGTDWFHEIFKPAPIMSHNLSVAGGSEQGSYMLSFNYFNQEGTLRNTYLKRYTLRSNTSFNVNKHIRIGENVAFSIVDNPRSGILEEGGGIGMAYRMQPIVPVYDIRGNYAGSYGVGLGNARNPVAVRDRAASDKGLANRLLGNVFIEADVFKDFTLRSSFGGSLISGYNHSFAFPEYENAENNTTNGYRESSYYGYNWTWTNTVTWEKNFKDLHSIKVLAGTEAYQNKGRSLSGNTQAYFSFDPNYVNLGTGSATPTNGSGRYSDALYSLIGRIDYSFKDRYLISGTIRRDGSSRFLNNRYGVFPAVSAGWRISEEDFMKPIEWIDDLKIRGGYGIMGNQLNVGSANGYTTYGQNRSHSFYDIKGSSSSTVQGFQRQRIGNPDAKWESNINSNIGLDATLFGGQLEITVDYYNKVIKDLLFGLPLAAVVGQGTVPAVNVAEMSNKGLDLSIYGEKQITSNFKLNATATFTSYNNKLNKLAEGIDYFEQEGRRFNGANIVRNQVGQSIGSFFGYDIAGFWNSQAEIDAANNSIRETSGNKDALYQSDVAVGRFRYSDINGDGKITADDRTFLGNPSPKFSYGLNIGANYKNFDFGIFFYGVQGNDIWNQLKWWHDFNPNFQGAKSYTALNDSWTPQNMNAKAPIQETKGSFSTTDVPNSYYVENGSYLRAKNAQIGYVLPTALVNKLKVDRVRVYVQAANLFTITKYTGVDPEIGQSQVEGSTAFGLDEGAYPNQRQFLFGINLTF